VRVLVFRGFCEGGGKQFGVTDLPHTNDYFNPLARKYHPQPPPAEITFPPAGQGKQQQQRGHINNNVATEYEEGSKNGKMKIVYAAHGVLLPTA